MSVLPVSGPGENRLKQPDTELRPDFRRFLSGLIGRFSEKIVQAGRTGQMMNQKRESDSAYLHYTIIQTTYRKNL